MQLENLMKNYPSLLSRLETDGYSTAYISSVRGMIKSILSKADENAWKDYAEIRQHFEEIHKPKHTLIKKCTILGAIMEFDLNGKFPDRTTSALSLSKRGAYNKLSPEFKMVIDSFRTSERVRGKKESSIQVESSNAASFLIKMQEAGAVRLCEITEDIVVPMFNPSNGSVNLTYSNRKCTINVIRAYSAFDPLNCSKVLAAIPPIKRVGKKNAQYLKEQEKQAVLFALNDLSNDLSLRERAIGTLAYYTGLRSSDMIALDMTSVDWARDLIFVKQQKTGVPLEIPVAAPVGNAIYDYICHERPTSECPAIFLTKNKPYRRLRDMWNASDLIFSAANIRQSGNDREGLHLFRHHVATSLMGRGVPQAVISDALGHADPKSLEAYLSADMSNLRTCALSIESFPVNEEVFANA